MNSNDPEFGEVLLDTESMQFEAGAVVEEEVSEFAATSQLTEEILS